MYGKLFRIERILHSYSRRACIVPMDHGTTIGPVDGIKDYIGSIRQVIDGGADAVILHKGLLKSVAQHKELLKGRYILHLSASTMLGQDPSDKVLVGTVDEAIKLGAEGVSMHVNLGSATEAKMLRDLGKVADACQNWEMPLLAMMYTDKKNEDFSRTIHAARLAEELGADIVKIDFPRKTDRLDRLIQSVRIPVLIAGGAKLDNPEELLYVIAGALDAGVAGVAIGRNIFQSPDPKFITGLISKMVHGDIVLKEALLELKCLQEVAL